jgi:aminopeptidase N
MSTYLVAFVIGDFQNKSDGNFTVWARSEKIGNMDFTLSIGPKILQHFENYLDVKFPIPKMDIIALPSSAVLGMENYGLIVLGESTVLFDEFDRINFKTAS